MSEEALQIAERRREVKDKGEREQYTQLNAEFQRIAKRDKKTFLNEQCKEIEVFFLLAYFKKKKIKKMKGWKSKQGKVKWFFIIIDVH